MPNSPTLLFAKRQHYNADAFCNESDFSNKLKFYTAYAVHTTRSLAEVCATRLPLCRSKEITEAYGNEYRNYQHSALRQG